MAKIHPQVSSIGGLDVLIDQNIIDLLPKTLVYSTKLRPQKIKARFDEFEWVIVAEFCISEDAYDHEQLCIYLDWDHPLLLNESCYHGKARFRLKNHTEASKQKIGDSQRGRRRRKHTKEESKAKSARQSGVTRGPYKPSTAESRANYKKRDPMSAEQNAAKSARQIGRPQKARGPASAEHRAANSASQIGIKKGPHKNRQTPEQNAAKSARQIGKKRITKPHSEATKAATKLLKAANKAAKLLSTS